MKVAVTAQGPDFSSLIYLRFDMARYFIVLDTETGELSAHDNTHNRDGTQAAAIRAAESVVDMGVDAVVTCTVGPEAFVTLQEANVAVHVGATGSVREAIEQFKAGRLPCAVKPNVESHVMIVRFADGKTRDEGIDVGMQRIRDASADGMDLPRLKPSRQRLRQEGWDHGSNSRC